jgi:hypothetical protein
VEVPSRAAEEEEKEPEAFPDNSPKKLAKKSFKGES